MKAKVGDWIRFHRNGYLHIGVVEYVRSATKQYPYSPEYVLSCGVVGEDEILEVRDTDRKVN